MREEHVWRWKRGELPTLAEYKARFPNGDTVEQAFSTRPEGGGVRYALLKKLGEGGFGGVFLARDTELLREVAVKVLHQQRAAPIRVKNQFEQEVKLAAALDHPHIVRVHDTGKFGDDRRFVVMEYIGGTLEERLRERAFGANEAVELLLPIVDAVAYAHERGLVAHRDLKPANILLDAKGKPHIADFGLAVTSDEERLRRQERAGTRHYMAPEQIRNGRYDRAEPLHGCDIFAFGVILYRMLAGRVPFENFEEIETIHRYHYAGYLVPPLAMAWMSRLKRSPSSAWKRTQASDTRQPGI